MIGDKPRRDGVKEAAPTLEDAYMLLMGERSPEEVAPVPAEDEA